MKRIFYHNIHIMYNLIKVEESFEIIINIKLYKKFLICLSRNFVLITRTNTSENGVYILTRHIGIQK